LNVAGDLGETLERTKLIDCETMLAWAKSMRWKGIHPVVQLSRGVYEKGISLSKQAMQAVEARLNVIRRCPSGHPDSSRQPGMKVHEIALNKQ